MDYSYLMYSNISEAANAPKVELKPIVVEEIEVAPPAEDTPVEIVTEDTTTKSTKKSRKK